MAYRGPPTSNIEDLKATTHPATTHASPTSPDTSPSSSRSGSPRRFATITGLTDNLALEDASADYFLAPVAEESDGSESIASPPPPTRHLSDSVAPDWNGRKRSNGLERSDIMDVLEDIVGPDITPNRDQVPVQVIAAPQKYNRPQRDDSFRQFALELTHSKSFNRFMLMVILVNAIAIALEMEILDVSRSSLTFATLNDIFLACYTVEFLLKFYADRIRYWLSSYNLFDFVILLVAYLDIILSVAAGNHDNTFMDMMRSLRSFRALKIVNFLPGVQVIADALASTLKQLISDVILLLFLLMFVFGVMGFYFFGYDATSALIIEQWGSISATFLSLFTVVTADRWSKFIEDLVSDGGTSLAMARSYIISFLFIGHFITANLFIAVIITNIEKSSSDFKDKLAKERDVMVRERKKQYWERSRQEVKRMMAQANCRGSSNFTRLATEFYFSIQKRDFVVMSDLKTNLLWADTILKELGRNQKLFRRSLNLYRDIVSHLAPVCNETQIDWRKHSVTLNDRFVLPRRPAVHNFGRRNSTGHRNSYMPPF